jgi:hypothetical protein
MVGTVAKWLGRLTALLLLLSWGGFFVEHLAEWFLYPSGPYPPRFVWVSQAFHFAIVVGLALMLKWDKPGALVTFLATTGFFVSIGDRDILPFALINLVPIACFSVSWLNSQRRPEQHQRAPAG